MLFFTIFHNIDYRAQIFVMRNDSFCGGSLYFRYLEIEVLSDILMFEHLFLSWKWTHKKDPYREWNT